jgi:hypothetical protein
MFALLGAGPTALLGPGFKKSSPSPCFVNVEWKYTPNARARTDRLFTVFNGAMGTLITQSRELFMTEVISTV